ncbi:MAG TPA: two-component sensor histidine kinase [Propionibacterium sp.]|nr:two-component sensor histidine kinase [Propionibacterium sp.]
MSLVLEYELVGDGARPPWWRTLLLVLPISLLSLASVVFSPLGSAMSAENPDGATVLAAAGALTLAFFGPVVLFWRHRFPFLITVVAALVAVVIPIGNLLAFGALAALIGRRRGPAVWATTALVTATSTWVVIADALAQPREASVSKTILGPPGGDPRAAIDLAPGVVVTVALVGLAVTIGAGFLIRLRRQNATVSTVAQTEREASDRLGDEAARRQERERIAREVHDAMGHRLSLLNLHAGALELNAGDDPRLQQSAHLVRQSAGEAMDDLRGLLQVLREPLGDEPPAIPLSRLPEVVRDSFGAGQVVNSSIFISEAERADPQLSRGVYRIVQEVLTNARKHAPGEPVHLTVEGDPATGVVIEARNRYVPGPVTPAGSARGLKGIAERAELLGGRLQFGLDEGNTVFRVRVELPWREAPASR